MTATIAFTGGTAKQQQAIAGAHATLVTTVPAAATAAGQGGTAFTTWFGSGPSATVVTAYNAVASALGSALFAYDLTARPRILLTPGACVMYLNVSGTRVSAQVWDGVWPSYYLDRGGGSAWLASSIFHETAIAFAGAADFCQVVDASSAKTLATVAPDAAVRCAVNLEGFLAGLLPAGAPPLPGEAIGSGP